MKQILIARKKLCPIAILIFCMPCFGQNSTNFRLLRANIANGGGVIQSTNLKLNESTFGAFAIGASSSSSFMLNGGTIITSVEDGIPDSALPTSFQLLQNYPNPFNPETAITYALPEKSEVKIKIFNALGQLIRTLDQGFQQAGHHRVQWDGKNNRGMQVSSGVYYYQMLAGQFTAVRKMLLLR